MRSLVLIILLLAACVLVLAVLALASLAPHAGVVLCLTVMLGLAAEVLRLP